MDDGMMASTKPGWLQTVFDTLTVIFDQAGMKKNINKTMRMVCHPCRAAGVREDKSYTWRMKGAGMSYRGRH